MVLKLAYYNFWSDPNNDEYFTNFIKYNFNEEVELVNPFKCKDVDILICSCMGNIKFVNIIKAKCKIFYYGENLNRYPPYNDDKLLRATFDLIVGFKPTNILNKTIRFPLWLIYYPYYKYNDIDSNILSYITSQYNKNRNNKTKFGCLVARHDIGGQRKIIYDTLSKYGTIDCTNSFNNSISNNSMIQECKVIKIGSNLSDKIDFISKYTYNICPENSEYVGYCTEKIFQSLEGGCIPLYWGIDNPELDIINENKYCFCNITDTNKLNEQIHNSVANPDIHFNGPLFKQNAHFIIKEYYNTLYNEIKKVLDTKK